MTIICIDFFSWLILFITRFIDHCVRLMIRCTKITNDRWNEKCAKKRASTIISI